MAYMASEHKKLKLIRRDHAPGGLLTGHAKRVYQSIKTLGANKFDMFLPETHILPSVILPHEKVEGIVYGKFNFQNVAEGGRGVLVATPHRVLLIDRKPLYMHTHEITYRNISGISYSHLGLAGTVTLNTRVGNIYLRTFNRSCANGFVEAVEDRIFTEDQGLL
jgi:Bacterial PH domain